MLTWIVIIFALAMIFGVIKVEQLKDWYEKGLNFIQTNLDKKNNAKKEKVEEQPKSSDDDK